MNRNQLTNRIATDIGIPDDLETAIFILLNDKFCNKLIDKYKYYSLSSEITDAKILIRLTRAMLFRIIDEIMDKDE
jgi:hypothetical protein